MVLMTNADSVDPGHTAHPCSLSHALFAKLAYADSVALDQLIRAFSDPIRFIRISHTDATENMNKLLQVRELGL